MSGAVVSAQGLTKRYGGIDVVRDIDLAVERGETFGLLGPNGAGKTTTILMLLGLTDISAGQVRVLDCDPAREPLAVKRRVGYMPDSVGFYDHLTAAENLSYTGKLMGIPASERATRIMDALARVRLAQVATRRVATFSRGMRQRLGLAEIIMKQAEIAILDEPTSGLDPQSTLEFLDLIRDLKADGVTVLLSSHLLDQVQRICDRVALFETGRIVRTGSVAELAREVLGGGVTVDVEAEGEGLEAQLRGIAGVSAVQRIGANHYRLTADRDVRPDAARAVVSGNGSLTRLSVEEPSLEAIYASVFQRRNGGEEVRDAA